MTYREWKLFGFLGLVLLASCGLLNPSLDSERAKVLAVQVELEEAWEAVDSSIAQLEVQTAELVDSLDIEVLREAIALDESVSIAEAIRAAATPGEVGIMLSSYTAESSEESLAALEAARVSGSRILQELQLEVPAMIEEVLSRVPDQLENLASALSMTSGKKTAAKNRVYSEDECDQLLTEAENLENEAESLRLEVSAMTEEASPYRERITALINLLKRQ